MMEENEVKFKCGTGDEAYTVSLTGIDRSMLKQAETLSVVMDKEGEERIAAILESIPAGGVLAVERRRPDGQLTDGVNGEPAVQQFSTDGKLYYEAHFKDGQENDAADGTPAVRNFNVHGKGKLWFASRFKNGALNDAADGAPAVLNFNDKGKLVSAFSYRDGEFVKKLGPLAKRRAWKKSRSPEL